MLDRFDSVDQDFTGDTTAHRGAEQAVDVEQAGVYVGLTTLSAWLLLTARFCAVGAVVESFVVVYSHGVTPWDV
ncbi:hypothetical protein D3C73_1088400 [compost metagenome]